MHTRVVVADAGADADVDDDADVIAGVVIALSED